MHHNRIQAESVKFFTDSWSVLERHNLRLLPLSQWGSCFDAFTR
jgi:hypothetical protein